MTLPDERVPFPVAPVFRVRPDLQRWSDDDRGHLRLDARYPSYLTEKLRLLAADPGGCRVLAPCADRTALTLALVRVAEALGAEAAVEGAAPARSAARTAGGPKGAGIAAVIADAGGLHFPLLGVELERGTLRASELRAPGATGLGSGAMRELAVAARRHLAAQGPLERLADALALAVQEDLVIMRLDAAAGVEAAPGERAAAGVEAAPGERAAPDGDAAAGGDAAAAEAERDAASPPRTAGTAPRTDGDRARAGGRSPGPTGGASREGGSAELLHVCFPSGWDPAARAGAGFAALHAPVPHGEALRRAAPQLVRAMVSRGPFVRYVWSLAPDARLDRNPRRQPDQRASRPPQALWFWVERQTVMPLPELGRALFTIRVYVTPLASVLTDQERRRTLASAVASMDAEALAYKGIGSMRDPLLAWLTRGGPTAS